ncbi:hypothetical protein M2271_001457 [Streptomyces sp. LBL]|uniref:hypothetical protein n=1 Tax=Streptomyces sp. LBL TaxID=2940562 RepID=UPI0024767C64|nr:hypothetical protein [Streptomyces sp. LBL]MDH6623665.1 hypothetical protein [Streptomyces sp. LBL]
MTPNAAAVGIAFSGGGAGPLVTLERTGKELSFSWPAPLPAPALDGDTATYADVLPDVDLRMRATADGFAQLLVVKTSEAAKNPTLAELKLAVESPGLDLRATESGGLEAVDEAMGGVVFQAPKPVMWDSGTQPSAASAARTLTGVSTSTSVSTEDATDGPGDAAKVASVDVGVTADGGQLHLTPDQGMLTAPDTTFPVFIDPMTYTPKAGEWTMAHRGGHPLRDGGGGPGGNLSV